MKIKYIIATMIVVMLSGCGVLTKSNTAYQVHEITESELVQEEASSGHESTVDKEDTPVIDGSDYIISLIEPNGRSVSERILCPTGFERSEQVDGTFAHYLRNSLLKPDGSEVLLFDGRSKWNQSIHAAVLDIDVGERDLQQCADATMRLWAEYLRSIDEEERIQFEFTNGFLVAYSKWMDGYRIEVDGNEVTWIKSREPSNSDDTFMSYMQMVYAYAGTLSLANELQSVKIDQMQIGDVFVEGGSPGHAVIVVDMAINIKTGDKVFLLAQSFMPAQSIHILVNLDDDLISPWYRLDDRTHYQTPEWRFGKDDLKRYE